MLERATHRSINHYPAYATDKFQENLLRYPLDRDLSQGGSLGLFGWGCSAWALEPLAYTRASSIYQFKLLENHTLHAAHTYIAHIWQYPPSPGRFIQWAVNTF